MPYYDSIYNFKAVGRYIPILIACSFMTLSYKNSPSATFLILLITILSQSLNMSLLTLFNN